MTELERRALLGDKQAQEECTAKGIVLPCPCCGGKGKLEEMGYPHHVYCEECGLKTTSTQYGGDGDRDATRKWNTRPAPPIGRCKDCRWYEYGKAWYPYCNHPDGLANSVKTTDFCSFFEPKEESR